MSARIIGAGVRMTLAIGATIAGATLYASTPAPIAVAEPSTPVVIESDTGRPIVEDSRYWDCTVHGDRRCGPTNSNGAVPGCYGAAGVLVTPWPCGPTAHGVAAADGAVPGPVVALASSSAPMRACEYSDGNRDGSGCTYTDPDTGNPSYRDSSNYRVAR